MSRGNLGFCITINNPSEEEKAQVAQIIDQCCDIGIAEMEHIDEVEEHTPHIQGYFHFKSQKRCEWIKKRLARAHIEVAKGGWKENFVYCSKEGHVFKIKGKTLEEATKKEKNNARLLSIIADAKRMSIKEFEAAHPEEWYKNRERVMRTMIDAAADKQKHWDGELKEKNIWIWGEPGIGKSKWADQQYPPSETYRKNCNKWWDGYQQFKTKCVIIEDYPNLPQGAILTKFMKDWSDRYPFNGECKGSHMNIMPDYKLIVTSNYPIDQCFQTQEDIGAIKRRFNEIHMTKENKVMIENTKIAKDNEEEDIIEDSIISE